MALCPLCLLKSSVFLGGSWSLPRKGGVLAEEASPCSLTVSPDSNEFHDNAVVFSFLSVEQVVTLVTVCVFTTEGSGHEPQQREWVKCTEQFPVDVRRDIRPSRSPASAVGEERPVHLVSAALRGADVGWSVRLCGGQLRGPWPWTRCSGPVWVSPMPCLGELAHCLGFSGMFRSPWLHPVPSEGSRRRERNRRSLQGVSVGGSLQGCSLSVVLTHASLFLELLGLGSQDAGHLRKSLRSDLTNRPPSPASSKTFLTNCLPTKILRWGWQ